MSKTGCFIVLTAVLIALIIVGAFLGKVDFWTNILAELVGLILGILATLTIVEYLLKKHREKEWDKIKQITLKQIATHIADMYTNFEFLDLCRAGDLFSRVINGRNKPLLDAYKAMTKIPEEINKTVALRIKENEEALIEDIESLYKDSKWDISQILEVLLPRVMEISEDKELISEILKLDEYYRAWENARIANRKAGIGYDTILNRALDTFKAAAEVYRKICKRWSS